MTGKMFFSSVAIAAIATGSAFAQTQQQQPAAEQQSAQQQQQRAAEQQQGQVEVQVVQPEQDQTGQPAPEQVARGECAARMEEVAGGQFFVGPEAGYRQHSAALSALRDAAMQLQADGLEEACLRVVEAMEIAVQTYQTAEAPQRMAARGDVTREQLEERLVPLDASEMPINTARLEGSDLHNFEGQDIGDIEGFLMAQGSPTHVIVSHGGFWDIGDNDVAIPLDIVRWDPEWQSFFAPLSEEQMDEAPAYDESAWDGQANDRFYETFRG